MVTLYSKTGEIMKNTFRSTALLILLTGSIHSFASHHESDVLPDGIWVRPGYELTVADDTIEKPRFMQVSPDGVLYVSVPAENAIKACFDEDKDGKYETIVNYVEGYETVHGVEWHDGWLWFTQTDAIHKAKDTDGDGKADQVEKVLGEDQIPSNGQGHWWRAILIHNDRIHTMVGDPSNFSENTEDMERTKIWSFALDGSDKKLFSTGVRNTEKFAVRPGTDEIWGCDHDIDRLYDSIERRREENGQPFTDLNPHAELNHYVEGGFYGHPYIVANRHPNPAFFDKEDLVELGAKTIVPEWLFPSHCSANGMDFYNHDQFPDAKGDAFIAMRGSWNNQSNKVGYCIQRVLFEYGHPYGSQKMVNFLNTNEDVLGRPADVTVDLDGSLLISDDTENHIYRLKYVGNE